MVTCRVCEEVPPKYRCPRCGLRYCSVGCYKKHKGHYSGTDEILDNGEESDRVPLEKLRRLAGSEKLKGLLCNPHLKQLLLTVDKAEDKESIMKTAMQEPIFVEFADQCLQIVEPPEKENETVVS
ncbi:zinc finger HIT domain-containing protein 3 isoform X7 [Chiloscyllium punctatum]|uniref:zinc finger HIT domain-containing protein 3 isoform X7 n=1 Tax=Chiloscyllium punctatum TaxID=137246 RepID=UPI003B6366E7